MQYSKDQITTIFDNAPAGVERKQILQGLVERGHTIDWFTPPPKPITGGLKGVQKEQQKELEILIIHKDFISLCKMVWMLLSFDKLLLKHRLSLLRWVER